MTTYTVAISQRPLGVRFDYLSNEKSIGVHQVTKDSHGAKLGLAVGDILVAINHENISKLSSSEVLRLFTKQTLPFDVTFKMHFNTMEDESMSDSEELEDSLIYSYINASATRTSTPTTTNNKLKDFPTYEANEDSVSSSSYYIDGDERSEFSFSKKDDFEDSVSYKPLNVISERFSFPKDRNSESIKSLLPPIKVHTANTTEHEVSPTYSPTAATETTIHLVNGFMRSSKCIQKIRSLITEYLFNDTVEFDLRIGKISKSSLNSAVIMLSSNAFSYGTHEWTIKIKQCDVFRQEIGVIENIDYAQNFIINSEGIAGLNGFGARAMYANESRSQTHYYASYNDNGKQRCKKQIKNRMKWSVGDEIKTILNLKVGNIQFFMNGAKVRKKCSIQKGKTYFPFIAFEGHCEYELINFSSS